jgi:AAA domain
VATEKTGGQVSMSDFEAAMFDLEGSAEYANFMFYGDAGCGKTVLAGTLPGRVLYLAGEPGYISAARQGAKGKVRIIPDTATANAAMNWLEDGHAREFDWVVPDGLSTMGVKFLLGYTAEAFDKNPASRAHRNLPDKPDYYNTQNFMKAWMARLIDLPVNTLTTAHVMRPEDGDGELMTWPSIQGKGYEVSNYICGLMHVVGYMSTRLRQGPKGAPVEQVRRILWRQYVDPKTETRHFAKDQFDSLGLFSDDTTMPEVLSKIEGIGPPVKVAPQKATRRRAA